MSNCYSSTQPRSHDGCRLRLMAPMMGSLLLIGVASQPYASEEDDYLKAIEMETEKVESSAGSAAPGRRAKGPGTANDKAVRGNGGLSPGLPQDEFERQLAASYAGSGLFYRKLARSEQEEIYEEYMGGATIDQIRQKIMDRFLNR